MKQKDNYTENERNLWFRLYMAFNDGYVSHALNAFQAAGLEDAGSRKLHDESLRLCREAMARGASWKDITEVVPETMKAELEGAAFRSPEEMFGYLQDGSDLYNPDSETYAFLYNEEGSICTYSIRRDEAAELAKKAREADEYWGAFLGPGGSIHDAPDNLEWCREHFAEPGWRTV